MNKSHDDNKTDYILSYINKNGVVDKDKKHDGSSKGTIHVCRKHRVRVILDLHGMKSEDALRKTRSFFDQTRSKGIKEILIIHGRGIHSNPNDGPVLKTLVRNMLDQELGHIVRDYRTARPKDGGEGATLVYLT